MHPSLTRFDAPQPRAVIVMLHGGTEHSERPVDGRSASWQRSRWMQRSIAPRAAEAGVSTWLLRFAHAGWNASDDGEPAPVPDARWALDQVRGSLGDVPAVLLGHSMGGRTAARVADDPAVVGVVALAPWFPPGEPVVALRGKRLVAAHGRRDRITSFAATRDFTARARRAGVAAEVVDMGRGGHYMFAARDAWDRVALESSLAIVRSTILD